MDWYKIKKRKDVHKQIQQDNEIEEDPRCSNCRYFVPSKSNNEKGNAINFLGKCIDPKRHKLLKEYGQRSYDPACIHYKRIRK